MELSSIHRSGTSNYDVAHRFFGEICAPLMQDIMAEMSGSSLRLSHTQPGRKATLYYYRAAATGVHRSNGVEISTLLNDTAVKRPGGHSTYESSEALRHFEVGEISSQKESISLKAS